jgi:hypothetical protein
MTEYHRLTSPPVLEINLKATAALRTIAAVMGALANPGRAMIWIATLMTSLS